MFHVIITSKGQDREYEYVRRIIALRTLEIYKKQPDTDAVSVVHQTRRVDKVIATWERP